MNALLAYARRVLARRRIESEVDDELRFHLEMETEANRARGLSPAEARRVALADLGGVIQTKEAVRGARTSRAARAAETAWQDLRYSVRTLRRSPAFATVAVLVLALGVGVNTAVFSIVNAVFFRTLPVHAPEQLVYIYSPSGPVDIALFRQGAAPALADVTAHSFIQRGHVSVFSANGRDEQLTGELVTANYFDVLGVKPMLGRAFRPEEEDLATTEQAVVISHDVWTRFFDRDPTVLGKQARIENKFFTIVGVAGPAFVGLSEPWNPSRYWLTQVQYYGGSNPDVARAARNSSQLIGRLRPGVTIAQARAVIPISAQTTPSARSRASRDYLVLPAADVLVPSAPNEKAWPVRLMAYAMSAVVSMVLLIATANIAGILMARGVTRASEIAVRQALGAGAWRLVRQLLTESVLLSTVGGVAGLFVAWLLIGLYRAYSPSRFLVDVTLDLHVLLFTAAVCVGAGVFVGLAPAIQARKVNVIAALGGGAAAGTTRRVRRRLRHGIVIPQVALSIILLIVAGVHARTLLRFELTDFGYRLENLAVLRVSSWEHDADGRAFFRRVLEGVRGVPGITAAGFGTALPSDSLAGAAPRLFASKDAYRGGSAGLPAEGRGAVSSGLFEAMGVPLISGRDFDDNRDTITSPHVAIISESLARRLWPAGNAIGQSIAQTNPFNQKPSADLDWREVIGVVGDTQPVLHGEVVSSSVYSAVSQMRIPSGVPFNVVASGPGNATAILQRAQFAIAEADRFAQISSAQTMAEVVGERLYPRRAAAWVLGVSGLAGLLLAAIGLYGVISYSVAQRLREIGIRATLGAARRDVMALVLRESLAVAVLGALPGFGLSIVALRLTSSLVGPVPTADRVVFTVVPALIAAVILLASYIPARRAARVDPMLVLRGL